MPIDCANSAIKEKKYVQICVKKILQSGIQIVTKCGILCRYWKRYSNNYAERKRKGMKKKNNRSTKIAVTSTAVVIALIGASVVSLHSLSEGKNEDVLKLVTVNDGKQTGDSSSAKLLTKLDDASAEYKVSEIPAQTNTETKAANAENTASFTAKDESVVTEPVGSLVVVDNVIDDVPETELAETEAAAPDEIVLEEPVYQVAEAPVYEEPEYEETVYEYSQASYYESEYEYSEPEYSEPEYAAPESEEPYFEIVVVEDNDWNTMAEETEEESEIPEEDSDGESGSEWVYDYESGEWVYYTSEADDNWSEPEYEEPAFEEPEYDDPIWENSDEDAPVWEDPGYDEPEWDEPDDSDWYDEPAEYPSNVSLGQQIVDYAAQWVGVTPYVDAADRWVDGYGYTNSLTEGTDCSGFTYLIYGAFGIYVPTGSDAYQYSVGTQITYDDLLPGDIVVYRYGGHVAIYAGNDMIIHCSNPELGTIYSSMWYSTPTAYVRVVY